MATMPYKFLFPKVKRMIMNIDFPGDILDKLAAHFQETKTKIAVAESVTSGLLQLTFSKMKEASACFYGGLTAYTLDQKVSLLKVDADEASACNCVSAAIAKAMAIGAARLFESDWSVATTGYATPVPESNGLLYAYYAIAKEGQIISVGKINIHATVSDLEAKEIYTEKVLNALYNLI